MGSLLFECLEGVQSDLDRAVYRFPSANSFSKCAAKNLEHYIESSCDQDGLVKSNATGFKRNDFYADDIHF